jgi:hypothetical protein
MANGQRSQKRGEVIRVVEVSIEVSNGPARFYAAVRAENIQRTASLVAARYLGRDCRVKFPVDPEVFW